MKPVSPQRVISIFCPHCEGSGRVQMVNGAWLRWKREQAGMSLRAFARSMELSAPFISDVERGHRNCSDVLAKAYDGLESR